MKQLNDYKIHSKGKEEVYIKCIIRNDCNEYKFSKMIQIMNGGKK